MDLNTEFCTARLRVEDSEPVKDLSIELCAARLRAEDSEPARFLTKPFV